MKIFSLLLFLACSSLGDKRTLRDEVNFTGGRYKQKAWKQQLPFERVTWFSRDFMEFDAFIAEVKDDSPFSVWFSGSEKKYMSECNKLYISLSTNNRSRVLSDAMYVNQMKKNNFSEVITPNFFEHLKMHPDYVRWNLTMYKPRLFCAKKMTDIIAIDFPSFETVKIIL